MEKDAFEELHIRDIPKNANLISSHCFFQIKFDGHDKKLKLKCRLVPHGNKDKEKDNIRSDSSTAQFTVIRALLTSIDLDVFFAEFRMALSLVGSIAAQHARLWLMKGENVANILLINVHALVHIQS